MSHHPKIHPGIAAAEKGDTLIALVELDKVEEHTPLTRSYYAYALARERGEFQTALNLCRKSMHDVPQDSTHYLNMGRIFLAAGRKDKAIQTFRQGLKLERNPRIQNHLNKLGVRRPEVFPNLDRNNPLNKYFGKLFAAIGLR